MAKGGKDALMVYGTLAAAFVYTLNTFSALDFDISKSSGKYLTHADGSQLREELRVELRSQISHVRRQVDRLEVYRSEDLGRSGRRTMAMERRGNQLSNRLDELEADIKSLKPATK